MQIITISGNLGKDAELRSTQGDDVLAFSVAVKQGFKQDAETEWFRCSLWGKRGANLKRYLTKGTKVVVHGDLEIGEYEGNVQFNVRVAQVEFMSKDGSGSRDDGGQQRRARRDDPPADDDLDDDVPF